MILLTMVENRCKYRLFISLSPDNVVADILGEEKNYRPAKCCRPMTRRDLQYAK